VISSEAVSSSSSSSSNGRPICRRRIAFHPTLGYPIPPAVPPKVARRNARERNRVKQVNCGFEMLRSHIPSAAKFKKMSKVDTLRHAVEYIQNLQQMIDEQHQNHRHSYNDGLTFHNLIQPPLTPTPSSIASSAPSPMTPHMPQIHQHHFTLPDTTSYPSPLTPGTPNTPTANDFRVPNRGYSPNCNDSGFGTSSFFSTNSSILSKVVSACNEMMRPHGQIGVDLSPVSSISYQRQTNQIFDMGSQYYNNFHQSITENPEEEELLDAIAKWQEQED